MADEPEVDPKDEPKDEPKKDEPKDEPKKDEPKRDEPKDEPKGDDLKSAVREVLEEMGLRGRGAPVNRGVDIEAMAEEMVAKASAKLQEKEELSAELADLKKKVSEVAEVTPIKHRPSTKIMGWGDKK